MQQKNSNCYNNFSRKPFLKRKAMARSFIMFSTNSIMISTYYIIIIIIIIITLSISAEIDNIVTWRSLKINDNNRIVDFS
jgi:magnesium-transporting ATPase (P-type)